MITKRFLFVPGISFVEITLGLFISSMLSVFLFQFFGQITKTSKTIGASLEYVTTIPTVFDQLERDITGIYVPEILYEPMKKREAPQTIDAQGKKIKQSPAPEAIEEKEAPEVRPIAFFCESKNNQFMLLSFITTNHLPRFKQRDPERILVVYRLIPDKEYPDSFALVRQQTTDILMPLKKFEENAVVEYTLLRRIKRFKVTLVTPEKEKKPVKAQNQGQPVIAEEGKLAKMEKPKITSEFSWTPDEAKKKMGVLIPSYIGIEGAYADSSGKQMREFKFVFKLYTFAHHADRMQKEREKKQQEKKAKKPLAKDKADTTKKSDKPTSPGKPKPPKKSAPERLTTSGGRQQRRRGR
ncbi:MAG: hypothetical protein UV38_C0003G0099 [candidate division TM6 bacterium GW2011_GWE2_42_60]|nr:MAG: hypothetical protein UV38_C0003G0099 [candidate division TM6 bacterium GW2011_GWE2_42_60]HBY05421.1 hypothetical protein [Candidatus Dependentiae bacterium]